MDWIGIAGKLCLAALDHHPQAVDIVAARSSALFALVYGGGTGCAAYQLVGKSALVVGLYSGSRRWALPGAASQSGIRLSNPDLTGLSSGDGAACPDSRTLPLAGIFCTGWSNVHRLVGACGVSIAIRTILDKHISNWLLLIPVLVLYLVIPV